MTTPSVIQAPKTERASAERFAAASGLPVRPLAAFAAAAAMVVLVVAGGRQLGLEPAMLLPLVVGGAAFFAGLSGAFIAGGVGGAYTVLYYSQPAWGGSNNGTAHAIATPSPYPHTNAAGVPTSRAIRRIARRCAAAIGDSSA